MPGSQTKLSTHPCTCSFLWWCVVNTDMAEDNLPLLSSALLCIGSRKLMFRLANGCRRALISASQPSQQNKMLSRGEL